MQVIYAGEQIPTQLTKSIFLAGPTPRGENPDIVSWRKTALQVLHNMDFNGVVFVPEPRTGIWKEGSFTYSGQIEWEEMCLNAADKILFWIPREMKFMPGLTTNDEFGTYKNSGKCVLGYPVDAEKIKYQSYYASKLGIPVYENLYLALSRCIMDLGAGTLRSNGETRVPLNIFNHSAFKSWYNDLKKAGNRLDDAKVLWSYRTKSNDVFCFSIWVKVWITAESRYKENEFYIGRPDISACAIYYLPTNASIKDATLIMVEEYRSPVSNTEGLVLELPGGSSTKLGIDPMTVVSDEVKEETGITITPDRIHYVGCRQVQSTTLSHKCHLYSVRINEHELELLKSRVGEVNGNIEDTERTYLKLITFGELLASKQADFTTIGMVADVLTKL